MSGTHVTLVCRGGCGCTITVPEILAASGFLCKGCQSPAGCQGGA